MGCLEKCIWELLDDVVSRHPEIRDPLAFTCPHMRRLAGLTIWKPRDIRERDNNKCV